MDFLGFRFCDDTSTIYTYVYILCFKVRNKLFTVGPGPNLIGAVLHFMKLLAFFTGYWNGLQAFWFYFFIDTRVFYQIKCCT